MLVLGRRRGEKIMVGEDVKISIVDYLRSKILILVEVPGDSYLKHCVEGTEIELPGNVLLKVLTIRYGGRVRLGFTAPPEVRIHRSEVYNRIRRLQPDVQSK